MLAMDVSFKFHHQKKMGFDSMLSSAYTGRLYNTSHFSTYAPTMESCDRSLGHIVDLITGFNNKQHMPSKESMKKISPEGMVRHQFDSQSMSLLVVGGFVGSKSQAGGSSHRGREINLIWDIICNKMKAYHMSNYPVNFYKKSADFQRGDACDLNMGDESKEAKLNKSYAEVTKGSPECIIAGAYHDLIGRQDWRNDPKVLPGPVDEPDRSCLDRRLENGIVSLSEGSPTTINGGLGIDVCLKAVMNTPTQQISSDGPKESPNTDLTWSNDNCTPCREPTGENTSIKNRTLSDCSIDSDDSFIVFDGPDHCDDILLEDSDDDFSEDENSDDDSEEVLNISGDVSTTSENYVTSANARWNLNYASAEEKPKKTSKKVTFADGKDLVKVKRLVVWAYAHRASRKANWDQVVLDRDRFKARINATAQILNRVLDPRHRQRIYHQRFNDD